MKKKTIEIPIQSYRNSNIVLFFFWTIIVFQLTVFKDTWNIAFASRIINVLLLLVTFFIAIKALTYGYSLSIWLFYLLPGLLLAFGVSINVIYNVLLNFSNFGFLALLPVWFVYLSIPFFQNKKVINFESLWNFFFYFMVISCLLSFIEYLLVFQFELVTLKVVKLQYGNFLLGFFTVFHSLGDDSPHFRFYGSFIEPGTLAMFLLPAIVFGFVHKKIFSLIILLIALIFSESLGGYASFFLAIVLLFASTKIFNFKLKIFATIIFFVMTLITLFSVKDYFLEEYEKKDQSREVRENNITLFFEKFPDLVLSNPFGITLNSDTSINEKNSNYTGSNFTPGLQFQNGGILAFLGYLFILFSTLIISIYKLIIQDFTHNSKIVYISVIVLFPFIFQRGVVLDSAIYGFLFSPVFIKEFNRIKLISK